MARRERGSVGRFFTGLIVVILILSLAAAVLYLLSDINSRRYQLRSHNNQLIVEQGRFMPIGFKRYIPRAEPLKAAYEPIPISDGYVFGEAERFDDRADLDRALFSLLAGWARRGLNAEKPEELERATELIQRCELLPGLSEQQRLDLKTLRADMAYRNGKRLVLQVNDLLRRALSEFRLSQTLGTSRTTHADAWIAHVQDRLRLLGIENKSDWPTPLGLPSAEDLPPGKELVPSPEIQGGEMDGPPSPQPKAETEAEPQKPLPPDPETSLPPMRRQGT